MGNERYYAVISRTTGAVSTGIGFYESEEEARDNAIYLGYFTEADEENYYIGEADWMGR